MRRESIFEQDYINWLKSLGCLVYLPLSADGDLQDRISELNLQLTGNGSLIWNNSQRRYAMTTPSSYGQHVAILDNGIDTSTFPTDSYSVCYRIKKITSSSSKYLRGISPNSTDNDTSTSIGTTWTGTARSNAFPSSEVHTAYVCNGNINRSLYQNGTLYTTAASYAPYLPSNWILQGHGILLGETANTSQFTYVQLYISEIYLFNTALDLTTIRKIQGYE